MRFSASALAGLLPLAAALPAGNAGAGTCTDVSHGANFEWTVDQFDFHASYIFSTPAHQNSWGYANFNLSNPALGYRAACSAASNQLEDFFYGNIWYNCTLPPEANGNGPATFRFARPSNQLDVNQTWACNEQQPPTTFKAAGTTKLDLNCHESSWQNPDWQVGEIYSTRDIKCDPATVPLKPYQLSAVL